LRVTTIAGAAEARRVETMTLKPTISSIGAALALTASAAALSPQLASAGDAKYYPGSMCHAFQGSGSPGNYEIVGAGGTAIKNNGTGQLFVMCPQIQDSTDGDLNYAQVLGRGDIVCSLFKRSWDGSSQTVGIEGDTESAGNGATRISFFSGPAAGQTDSGDLWGLWCVLGRNAQLVNYEFEEST
jgi:hypothetical protein